MELRTRRLVLTLCGSVIVSLGVLAACSSDSGYTQLPGGGSTAVDSGKKTSDAGDDADDDTDDDGDDQDAGTTDAGCSKLRTSARQYCFGARALNDAGSGCSTADDAHPEVCCADEKIGSTFTPAKCAATTPTADGYTTGACNFSETADVHGREYQCLESRHCPAAASACCVIKGPKGNPNATKDTKVPASCNQFYNSGSADYVDGTRCKTACESNEVHLCGSDEDCNSGESCYYFTLNKQFTGVCKTTIR